jgi:predicted DNA repair protein MutK
MSSEQARKLAKQFINEQKQILEAHGDRVVRSKYKDAIAGAERTFQALSAASVKLALAQQRSK